MFSGANDELESGDNWSYKPYKAPVKSSSTNQHSAVYRPMSFLSPTNSVTALKGKSSYGEVVRVNVLHLEVVRVAVLQLSLLFVPRLLTADEGLQTRLMQRDNL